MRTLSFLAGVFVSSLPLHAEVPRSWVEASGHRVVRLTPEEGGTKFYFHQSQFTDDGKRMVLSDGRGGVRVVELGKLPEVSNWVLTEEGGGSAALGRKSHDYFHFSGGNLKAVNLDTRATRTIGPVPAELARVRNLAINANESLLGGSYVEPKDAPGGTLPPRPRGERGQRRGLEDTMALKLPRRLFTVSTKSGEAKTFHKSTDWLNHVQFSPTDPALLMFCHEGTWQKVDRIWTIRAGGEEARLMHKRTMPLEIAGHEFFSADGKTVWFDLQTPREKEFWLAGVDVASGALTKYALTPQQWSVHFNISPDGKRFAGDGGGPKSVAKPHNGQFIWLFTPRDGKLEAEKLVDMAKHDYDLEPNVNFTPDGKWIVFQANMHGARHVYAVEVAAGQGSKP